MEPLEKIIASYEPHPVAQAPQTETDTGRFPVALVLAHLSGMADAIHRQMKAVDLISTAYRPVDLDGYLKEIIQNAEATIAKAKRLLAANR